MSGKVNWRDTFDVWPYIALTVKLLPTSWRFYLHREWFKGNGAGPGYWDLTVCAGPLQFEAGGNWPPFPLERTAPVGSGEASE